MSDRRVVADDTPEPTDEIEIIAGVPNKFIAGNSVVVDVVHDPFESDADQIKKMDGLDSNFKRRVSRELNKSHTGTGSARSKKQENLYGYSVLDVVTPPFNLDYLAKIYEVSGTNFAAINAKVANIVGLGYDWTESPETEAAMERATGNEEKLKRKRNQIERFKNELNEWLDGLHEEDTFQETLRKVWIDYEATGNGYIEIGRTVGGQIGYLGHIPSATMRVRTKRDGFVQLLGNKVVFFRNFGDRKTRNPFGDDPRPNEVIHLKKYSPSSSYYGIPDIISAKNALAGSEFASRYNLDYFEHKAVPRYVITVTGGTLSSASQQIIAEFFQTNLKGTNHRTIYVPLPQDAEFKMHAVEAGTIDASFLDYLKFNRDEILMAHRVPISKIGLPQGTSLAGARDADKSFKEQVCRPEQRILEKKLNKIIAERTNALRLKLNELTLTDEDTQSKIDERDVRMKIVMPNEVRARRGMPGYEGGDEPFEAKPQQAAEQVAQATGNRQREQQRTANATDSAGEARSPKGEGRTTP